MIARLQGRLIERRSDAVVVVASGVGYLVRVTLRTLSGLPSTGHEVDIYTHLHVTDGALDLYGFSELNEQRAFLLLLRVNGVGPRTAMQILSAIPPENLAALVSAGDRTRLRAVPGIGPKMAERLIVELRDKFEGALAAGVDGGASVDEQAAAALVGLGLKPVAASDAVRKARSANANTLEEIVRCALRQGIQP